MSTNDPGVRLVIGITAAVAGFAVAGPQGAQVGWSLAMVATEPTQRNQGACLEGLTFHGSESVEGRP